MSKFQPLQPLSYIDDTDSKIQNGGVDLTIKFICTGNHCINIV
jgi:hypothetical protein